MTVTWFSQGFLGVSPWDFLGVFSGFPSLRFPSVFPRVFLNGLSTGFLRFSPSFPPFDWGKPPMAFLVIFSGKSWGFLGWDSSKRFPSVFPTVSLFVKAYLKTELKTLRNICHHLALHRNATSP